MQLLVFQHLAVEHPGVLRRFLGADGIAWDAVELDQANRSRRSTATTSCGWWAA